MNTIAQLGRLAAQQRMKRAGSPPTGGETPFGQHPSPYDRLGHSPGADERGDGGMYGRWDDATRFHSTSVGDPYGTYPREYAVRYYDHVRGDLRNQLRNVPEHLLPQNQLVRGVGGGNLSMGRQKLNPDTGKSRKFDRPVLFSPPTEANQ